MGETASILDEITIGDDTDGFRIAPGRGGMVTALWLGGAPLLYLDRATFEDATASVRGGIPVLFPICGPLRADTAVLEGQSRQMKQHGFARSLPWTVQAQGPDHVTLALSSSERTLAAYPYAFTLRCTYRVSPGTLQMETEVNNRADREMPFSFGIHPYFATPDKTQVRIEVPARHAAENPFGAPHPFDALHPAQGTIDLTFTDIARPQARLDDLATGHTIGLQASDAYRFMVFWTLADRPFCCLEPWTARGDALNTGLDLIRVPPGETARLHLSIERRAICD